MTTLRFLLLEDSPLDAELIQVTLAESNMIYELVRVQTQSEFAAALQTSAFDLILSDYSLPDFDGISGLKIARRLCPEVPFIFVSATLGEELAIETLKNGATDYVLKQRLGRLVPSVQRALREARERRDLKQAEVDRDHFFTALEQTNQTLQALIESSPLAIMFYDTQGIVKLWNQAAEKIFGWSADEAVGQFLLTVPHRRSEFLANLQAALQGKPFSGYEVQHQRKDGQRVDLEIWATLICDAEGTPGCLAIAADITERKQSARLLQENSDRLKLLFETTSDLLSTEQPLTLMNDLFTKLSAQMELDFYLNYLVQEREGRRMLRLVSYDGIFEEAFQEIEWLEWGQGICGRAVQERHQIVINRIPPSTLADAQALYSAGITAFAAQPLIAQGRLLGVLAFASFTRSGFTPQEADLLQATSEQVAIALERAELVASLQRQKEQLTQANRIKDEFLAVLSHELRTPLNPILGWCRILRTNRFDQTRVERALEIIERNAKTQTQLIEDLLDVSRILRGKFSLNVCPVDLKQTIEAALETVHLAAEAKSINLQFTTVEFSGTADADLPDSTLEPNPASDAEINKLPAPKFLVLGDPSRLQQVVWNLLSNAVKFTPSGGQVEICLSLVSGNSNDPLPTTPPSTELLTMHYAQIRVSDTGKGINPNFLPHVFDYFRQADGSTTRTFGGLGLGLAIVNHLVQLHGGTIQADSPGEGQGATFTVRLPLMHRAEDKNSETAANLPGFQRLASEQPIRLNQALLGLRILLVDDERDTLDYIAFLLEQYGAAVTAVASVNKALESVQLQKPDIVISDIGMPQEDGYVLLHQIRSLEADATRPIPAIALTAYARDEDRDRVLAAGFQRHLSKPVEPAHLVAAVAALTGRD